MKQVTSPDVKRRRRNEPQDPAIHPQADGDEDEDGPVYPATTKWNPNNERFKKRYSRTDPRSIIASANQPSSEDRRWYSRATRTKETRAKARIGWDEDPYLWLDPDETLPALRERCFVCKVTLKVLLSDITSYPLRSWARAAANGYQDCDQITRGVRQFAEKYSLDVNDFHIATLHVRNIRDDDSQYHQEIFVGVFWVTKLGDMSEHLQFERYQRSDLSEQTIPLEPPLNMQSILLTAQNLVRICDRSHGCLSSSPDFSPTRLVDIQGTQDAPVKVVEASNLVPGTDARYIALSYCWGKSNPLRLLKSTSEQMRKRIDWSTLPTLFQDLVQLSRLLGINYVWVDALCIFQDDKTDWERESLLMGKIYRSAYLVIGATCCNDSSESLMPKSFKNIPILVDEDSSRFNKVFCSTMGGDTTWPLHSRGWTYQELILANRLLDFDSSGLQLHCQKGMLRADDMTDHVSNDESVPDRVTESRVLKERQGDLADFRQPWFFRLFWSQFLNPNRTSISDDDRSLIKVSDSEDVRISTAWHEVVMMYTNRTLTYASDLLPALSGIASEYLHRAMTGEEYCAGLWRNSFVLDLIWTANHEATATDAYRAPSWSWASIQGSVDYEYAAQEGSTYMKKLGTQQTKLIDVSCTTEGLNQLGAVTGGFAILEGLITPCRLKSDRALFTNKLRWYCQPDKAKKVLYGNHFDPDVAIEVVQHNDAQQGTVYSAQRIPAGRQTASDAESQDCEVFALNLFDLSVGRKGLFLILGLANPVTLEYHRLGLIEMELYDLDATTTKQVMVI